MRFLVVACALILSPTPGFAQSAAETFAYIFRGVDPLTLNKPDYPAGDYSLSSRGIMGSETLKLTIKSSEETEYFIVKAISPCNYMVRITILKGKEGEEADYVVDLTNYSWNDMDIQEGRNSSQVYIYNAFFALTRGKLSPEAEPQIYSMLTRDRAKLDKALEYFKGQFCKGRAF